MSGILQAKAAALLYAEQGTVQKDWAGKVAVALAFPDTYQVAVSAPGFQATYRHLNRCPEVVCKCRRALDEVFPWDHLEVGVTKEQLTQEYAKAGLA